MHQIHKTVLFLLFTITTYAGAQSPYFLYYIPGLKKQLNLSAQNIADIYMCVITTWTDPRLIENNPALKDITYPDLPISPVARSEACENTYYFTHFLSAALGDKWPAEFVGYGPFNWHLCIHGKQFDGGMREFIKVTPNSIGYFFYNSNLK